jgi:hypothetical protein
MCIELTIPPSIPSAMLRPKRKLPLIGFVAADQSKYTV